jgi:hypothetical protein
MIPLRKRMLEELQLRNLSETTIQTYLRLVERFAKHFGESRGDGQHVKCAER